MLLIVIEIVRLLEEVQRVVMRAGLRTDGPVSLTVLVFSTGVSHGAAPPPARVLPAVDPVSTAVVGDALEDEGEDAGVAC